MHIDIVTAFPEYFEAPLGISIVGRAREKGIITFHVYNLRDFTEDKHRRIDDAPYGGGPGMVIKAEPFFNTVTAIRESHQGAKPRVIFLTPDGKKFTQPDANRLAAYDHIVFLSGHYKGIDERIRLRLVDEEISIGDYVLTGGEIPTLVVIDAVVRLLPDVLGNADSAITDSFQTGLLDYPQYTRPEIFEGDTVPAILLSGHHAKIKQWRQQKALERTIQNRIELLNQNIVDSK